MSKYNHQKTEKNWQKKWLKEKIYEPDFENPRGQGKFYNLMMFPYPSAEGLHVGNMYAFTGSDIYGRFKRMQGYDVFEPIGLDGFGIHSENYAIKIGKHPAEQAKISEKRFYKQLESIGNGFAWNEKIETYDPEYYKWTQWIFVQMFKNGLAYRKKASVNWCPSCLTVLADEQVLKGECERCGTKVIKKELEQWFFRITKYADRLLANLDKINWAEKIKIAQKNWIGKSEGALIKFSIFNFQFSIDVFTTRPDTLFGATYMVLAPEHELINDLKAKIENWPEVENYIQKAKNKTETERIAEGREKTGVELKGIKAINPANQKEMSVWVADYVLTSYGTGAIMAVPAHDERDFEFAKKYNLPIKTVVEPNDKNKTGLWEGKGILTNSGRFNDMDSDKAKHEITEMVGGKIITTYRLRDWLISRQRYWGPPIPMIYCEECKWQPVPEEDLPIILPKIKNFRPTGTNQSPLASVEKFYKTKCPNCGGEARRETDVSDTFLDSAWYYLGYLAKFGNSPLSNEIIRKWCPIDMYIGGAEHAVLHLLYIRFLAMVFHDWKLVDFEEPVTKFRAHGLLIKDGAKMSKSKGNVVNPDEYIKKYGADVLRMYLMFIGPFESGGDFRDESIAGITRFIAKIWALKENLLKTNNKELERKLHKTIKKVTGDIEKLHYNTAISELMILAREIDTSGASPKQFEMFLKLLAPFAPHITEEIWRNILKNKTSIHVGAWPSYDLGLTIEEISDFVIQINGKSRTIIKLPIGSSEELVKKSALADERIRKYLADKEIKKIIFIPNRLINFVI